MNRKAPSPLFRREKKGMREIPGKGKKKKNQRGILSSTETFRMLSGKRIGDRERKDAEEMKNENRKRKK